MEAGQGVQYGSAHHDAIPPEEDNRLRDAINRALVSPPFLTVLVATLLAFVSSIISSRCERCQSLSRPAPSF